MFFTLLVCPKEGFIKKNTRTLLTTNANRLITKIFKIFLLDFDIIIM